MKIRAILQNRFAPIVFLLGVEWLFAIVSPAEFLLQVIIAAVWVVAHVLERGLRAE